MGDFEQWFEQQDFYPKMRYIHGDKLFINENNQYRILPVQMIYQTWRQWQTQMTVYKEDMQKDVERIAELEQKSQCIRNLVNQKAKAESKLNRIALAAQKKLGTFGAALRFNDEVKDILKGGDT